ncbi:Versican core protein [Exaiptasia diaphana]|nr:Versican core protein [Exaiptasia diaphana]
MAVRLSLVLLVVALAEAHMPWPPPRSSSQVRHSGSSSSPSRQQTNVSSQQTSTPPLLVTDGATATSTRFAISSVLPSSSSVIIWDDRCLCNPCLNGGSCVTQGQYDIACQCSPPYYGKYCGTRSSLSSSSSSSVFIWDDRCLWNPCQNGGSCVKQGQYDIACQCSPPYYGKYCGSKSISTIQPSSTRFAISSSSSSLYSGSSSVREPISTIQPSRVSRSSRPPLSTVQKRSHPVDKRSQTSDASCEHLSSMTQRVFADPRVDWKNIHPAIKDVAINLVRHDDHKGISPRAHALIRHALATNSLKDMRRIMSQRKNWKRVPINHFMLRKKHLDEALKNPFGFVLKRQSKMMTCE